ncbi:MAG: hypothetical protein R3249_02840 [Nitriliruptorales bacterium]|nr:hypothetical protein [Nitriliruptorales bacterium]
MDRATSATHRRTSIVVGVLAALLAPASAALAHHPAFHATGQFKHDVRVITDAASLDVPIARQTDNVEFVAHAATGEGSDLFFQRREGLQRYKGQVIDATIDLAVAGGVTEIGATILDVSDPTAPEVLAQVPCGGFHSEVLLYENLLLQTWDATNLPCDPDSGVDPDGLDRPDDQGVRIFDITDPAAPRLVAFRGEAEGIHPAGVHNGTVNAEAGLLYLNMAELDPIGPLWGWIDLEDPAFPVHTRSMRDISPTALDGCHDASVAPTRQLMACAAIELSYVWDISDPRNPVELAVIPNPGITIHHGARFTPDEQVLVLNDELAGAAFAPGCTGLTNGPIGALWFYNVSTPTFPVLQSTFSTSDLSTDTTCTSHFYNFTRDTTLLTIGWYEAGMIAVDYGGPLPTEHAHFEPEGSSFWAAYSWHGHVYGNSYSQNDAAGFWVIRVDGIDDVAPLATDEGNSWIRWTSALEASEVAPVDGPAPAPSDGDATLPATGGSIALLGVAALALSAWLRRRSPSEDSLPAA